MACCVALVLAVLFGTMSGVGVGGGGTAVASSALPVVVIFGSPLIVELKLDCEDAGVKLISGTVEASRVELLEVAGPTLPPRLSGGTCGTLSAVTLARCFLKGLLNEVPFSAPSNRDACDCGSAGD